MALTIEGIFLSKTVTSLQIKVYECQVKPLKPRESLLSPNEEESDSDSDSDADEKIDDFIKNLVISDKEDE